MALYWPHQHIALEVVDDPFSAPVERDAFPGLTVIPITRKEIGDPDALDRATRRLAREASFRTETGAQDARERLFRILAEENRDGDREPGADRGTRRQSFGG